jgi:dephospho-CoA kinase
MFVELGCHLLDADAIVHQLFLPGQPVNQAVIREFGPNVQAKDGSINRPVLGEIVFNHPDARQRLNTLVHPAVIEYQKRWLDELDASDSNAIGIVEAALMIEVGTYKNYDKVIVVTCAPEVQRQRLKERSGLAPDQIEARIASQMPMAEKVKFANFVIDNSGSLEDTQRQVADVHQRLRGN